jgi:hypothetical protein
VFLIFINWYLTAGFTSTSQAKSSCNFGPGIFTGRHHIRILSKSHHPLMRREDTIFLLRWQVYESGTQIPTGPVEICIDVEAVAGTPTPTTTPTPTETPTGGTPTTTPTFTRTPINTPTATRTPQATRTPTSTPISGPPVGLGCMSPQVYVLDHTKGASSVVVPLQETQRFALRMTTPATPQASVRVTGMVAATNTPVNETLFGEGPWDWPHGAGAFTFAPIVTSLDMFSIEVWVCPSTTTPTPGPLLPCTYSRYAVPPAPGLDDVLFTLGGLFEVMGTPLEVELTDPVRWTPLSGVGMWSEPTGMYRVRSTGTMSTLVVCEGSGTPTVTPVFATATPDPNAIVVSFSVASAFVGEAAGSLPVQVRLSRAQRDPITVRLSTTSWTAMVGTDLQAVNTTLVFMPGETLISVAIPIIDDLLTEDDELFHVRLYEPRRDLGLGRIGGVLAHPAMQTAQPQHPVLLGWPAVLAGTIIDDDMPQPTIPAEMCVLVPPTPTPGTPTPFPTLPVAFPTWAPLPPLTLPSAAPGAELTATAAMSQVATLIAEWSAPAATVSAWSATYLPRGWGRKGGRRRPTAYGRAGQGAGLAHPVYDARHALHPDPARHPHPRLAADWAGRVAPGAVCSAYLPEVRLWHAIVFGCMESLTSTCTTRSTCGCGTPLAVATWQRR